MRPWHSFIWLSQQRPFMLSTSWVTSTGKTSSASYDFSVSVSVLQNNTIKEIHSCFLYIYVFIQFASVLTSGCDSMSYENSADDYKCVPLSSERLTYYSPWATKAVSNVFKCLLNYLLAEMSNQKTFSSIGLVTLSWPTLDPLPG